MSLSNAFVLPGPLVLNYIDLLLVHLHTFLFYFIFLSFLPFLPKKPRTANNETGKHKLEGGVGAIFDYEQSKYSHHKKNVKHGRNSIFQPPNMGGLGGCSVLEFLVAFYNAFKSKH